MHDASVRKRVLVIEESATLRYMLGKMIKKEGYELISVDDFESAINLLHSSEQDLHAIAVGWPNYGQCEEPKKILTILDGQSCGDVPVILLANDVEVTSW